MKPIFFTRGVPPRESIPVKALAECAKAVITEEGAAILQYAPAAGYPPLREVIAQKKNISMDRVILGQGSLQILDILLHCLLHSGDAVAVEQPTYDRVLTLMCRAGLRIYPMNLEQDGLDLNNLENKLENGEQIRLIYTISDFQNPSGMVMALEKRKRLIDLASRFNFYIVEDSPYRDLRYEGEEVPSLFDLAPDTTIQLSSFSKLICPGLRVGYSVLPQNLTKTVAHYAEDTYINPSYLNHAIVHRFLQNGLMEDHLMFLKNLYNIRLKCMLSALEKNMPDQCTWTHPQGGFFVGFWLASNDGPALLERAETQGLRLSDGRGFFVNGGENFVRLPFCALTEEEIQEGISKLAQLIYP
ncbi:MAG: aminotransferase-like domain-containing protein [Anaerolineaceae bacterium]